MNLLQPWPDDEDVPLVKVGRRELYRAPDGDFPRVTTVTDFSGLGKHSLMDWAARTERDAAIEAAIATVAAGDYVGPAEFRTQVLTRIGPTRKHLADKMAAAEIGTEIHEAASWHLRGLTGQPRGQQPVLSDPARLGFDSWLRWWDGAGLTPIRSEQRLWCPELEVAGTIDLIAEGPDGVGVVDFKSSKGVYDSFHLQVAAYASMAKRWTDISWSQIVRFPKYADDPLVESGDSFRAVDLGDFSYTTEGGKLVERHIPYDELLAAFTMLRGFYEIMG